MFTSLRARLWFSYALLIFTALCIVMGVLILYLFRNPILYRQTVGHLSAVQTLVLAQDNSAVDPDIFKRMDTAGKEFGVRLLLFSNKYELMHDTGFARGSSLAFPRATFFSRKTSIVRDTKGAAWLYVLQQLQDQTWLMVAVRRPKVPVFGFLTDELMPPFIQGGIIALLLSLVMAYFIARWIADPLQGVVVAARKMPSDEIQPVETRGPHEVQDLTRAFNAMIARMQASQKAQREFVANVSHELKTPLTSVQGFAQALLDGTAESPGSRRQAAQVIFDESGRMHRMVLDLLDLTRLDSGIADLKMDLMDITALMRAIIDKFQPLAHKADIKLMMQSPENLPIIRGDGDRLAQVFTNLVENALKYTPAGGMITLRAAVVTGELCITVMDTGAGIPDEALPHIFDRFYQADSSRKGGEKHSVGLGLAIAREIIQAHGGRISAHSRLGEGTTFVVYLPLSNLISTIKKKI